MKKKIQKENTLSAKSFFNTLHKNVVGRNHPMLNLISFLAAW